MNTTRHSSILRLLSHPNEIQLLMRMLVFLAMLPILLKAYSFNRFLKVITPDRKRPQKIKYSSEAIIRYGLFLLKQNRFFCKNTCLKRSLLLYHFLRKYGIEVYIHFGIRNVEGYLAGHCWLTNNEKLLVEKSFPGKIFVEILAYPPGD